MTNTMKPLWVLKTSREMKMQLQFYDAICLYNLYANTKALELLGFFLGYILSLQKWLFNRFY